MATYEENLTTARDNIAARIATMSANPKPNYTEDGQSVSWGDLFAMLTQQLNAFNLLIAQGAPCEEVSQGYSE